MAAVFLAPNMLIFGVFVLFPLVVNIAYSMTGGAALFLPDRNFVGAAQYERLLSCTDYTDPKTCVGTDSGSRCATPRSSSSLPGGADDGCRRRHCT